MQRFSESNLGRYVSCVLFLFCVFLSTENCSGEDKSKPRVLILTDVSTWETDDSESLVRLFVHADLLEIEGLVFHHGLESG